MASNGDRNSRYFQQKAHTQRKRKLVCKLKDDCGLWIDNQRDNVEKFVSDYTTRFKANQVSNRNLLDLHLVSCISHSDNFNLIKISDMADVKQALFSVDSTKTPGPDGFSAGFFSTIGI